LDLTLEQIGASLFQVNGLPEGDVALIAGADYRGWRILRTVNGRSDDDWTGEYPTPSAALEALRRHFESK